MTSTYGMRGLYKIEGSNRQDGDWELMILANSPMHALDEAVNRKPWDVSKGLHISLIVDFYDATLETEKGED